MLKQKSILFTMFIVIIVLGLIIVYCGNAESPGGDNSGSTQQKISTPVLNPTGGTFSNDITVDATCSTSGVSIYYTTDDSTPSSSSTLFSSPIPVSGNGTSITIKVVAIKSGMTDSDITSGNFTINYSQVSTPQFSTPTGTYTTPQNITISTTTSSATIRYTTDGSTPTSSYGTIYSGPVNIPLDSSMTIKAIAYKSGMTDSLVSSSSYTVTGTVATPTFSPVGGTYTTAQSVTISTTTSGSTIRYTTDGSTPTPSYGTIYSSPVSISSTTTLKAIAYKTSWTDSSVVTDNYTITGTVATPTFSPVGGTYTTAQNVTISTTTSGATIRYTTDGSTPTSTYGTIYSSPVNVPLNTTMNIKAIAYKASWADSTIASSTYIVTGTVVQPTFSLNSGTYSTTQNVTLSTTTSGATIKYTTDGSDPKTSGTAIIGTTVNVNANMTVKAYAFLTNWIDSTTASNIYSILLWTDLGFVSAGNTMSNYISLNTSDNKPVIAYCDAGGTDVKKWSSGTTWIDLGYADTNYIHSLTMGTDNKPFCILSYSSGSQSVPVKKWSSGTTWTDLGYVDSYSMSGGGSSNAITINRSDNTPVVTFCENVSGNWGVYVKKWASGTTWNDLGCPFSLMSNYSSVAIGSDNQAVVTISNGNNTYIKKWSGGTTWTDLGSVSTSDYSKARYNKVVIDPSDNKPIIVYIEGGGFMASGPGTILVKKWSSGTSWSDLGCVSTDSCSSSSIVVDPIDNKPVVVFQNNSNGGRAQVKKWSSGTSWTDLGFISDGSVNGTNSGDSGNWITAGGNEIYVIYVDGLNGGKSHVKMYP